MNGQKKATNSRKPPKNIKDSPKIAQHRQNIQKKLSRLHNYHQDYTIEKLLDDLTTYFNHEVDFNLEKIHHLLNQPGKFEQLVEDAKQKHIHPVNELVQEILKTATIG